MILRVAPLSRGALLALTIAVTALLAWRVLVAGIGAIAERIPAPEAQTPGAQGESGTEASLRRRLTRNPADALALLLLALELERQGQREEAGSAMRKAVQLAPADPQTLLLVAGYFLRTGDEASALTTLRRAVDSSPGEVAARAWPVFAAALGTGRHQKFFAGIARENRPWWQDFFRYACARAASANGVQAVFAVRVAADVATVDERRCLIERLQRDGLWTPAYLVWLNGLPLEQRRRVGYVFNGDFELPLSNAGFDWRIPTQDSAVVSSEPGDGVTGRRGLNVTFSNQRYAGPPVYQILLLAPGRYQLEGRAKTNLEAWLGMQWGLYCQEDSGRSTRQLARSDAFVGSTRWREFRQDFVVPADCPAQVLRLELANPKPGAAGPGDVAIRLKGRVWFDDIRVRIVDEGAGRR